MSKLFRTVRPVCCSGIPEQGSNVNIVHNKGTTYKKVATIPMSNTHFQSEFTHCIPCSDFDIENDVITLEAGGDNAVS